MNEDLFKVEPSHIITHPAANNVRRVSRDVQLQDSMLTASYANALQRQPSAAFIPGEGRYPQRLSGRHIGPIVERTRNGPAVDAIVPFATGLDSVGA